MLQQPGSFLTESALHWQWSALQLSSKQTLPQALEILFRQKQCALFHRKLHQLPLLCVSWDYRQEERSTVSGALDKSQEAKELFYSPFPDGINRRKQNMKSYLLHNMKVTWRKGCPLCFSEANISILFSCQSSVRNHCQLRWKSLFLPQHQICKIIQK